MNKNEFSFPGQTGFYRGKVRDVYYINDDKVLMIASDRLSAFDVIMPKPIPYKGQVLTQLAAYMLEACRDICPVWLEATPAPVASLGKRCEPFKVEVVVRGYVTGHAWREYRDGRKELCGVKMPDGLKEYDKLPQPIITPSTKAEEGHDEDISREQIIANGLVEEGTYDMIENFALSLYHRGQQLAKERGLILADTKYEFGIFEGEIYLMDEIHTPDSSRYFYADGFASRQEKGEKQQQLSKEFVREWLISNNFMGKEGELIPEMSNEWIKEISGKYIELFEKVTGERFEPQEFDHEELYTACSAAIELLH